MDGAQLTGWVEHSRLTKLTGGIGFTGGRSLGSPLGRGTVGSVRKPGPGAVRGPAHINTNTPVFALPAGGAPWATIRDGEAEFEVIIEPGNDRAEVLRAPFIPHLWKAWVPLKAVHILPAKPGP